MIFICHHCKEPYRAKPSRASRTHYCSMKCKAAAQGHPNTFICQHCKKTYRKQPSLTGKTKYCSNKCRAAAHRRPEIHCKGCRVLFTPTRKEQVYCTPRCRKKNAGKYRMHRITKRCKRSACGKIMQVQWSKRNRANYCSVKCRSMDRRINRKPTSDQLKHLVIFMTYAQIGKLYNACGCTVMGWAKEYEIRSPFHKRQLRGPSNPHVSGYIGEAYGI